MLTNGGRALAAKALHSLLARPKVASPTQHSLKQALHTYNTELNHAAAAASYSRATTFWTTDEVLIKCIRRRQEAYRLREIGESSKKKADRHEAIQLARSEVRWIVQHVRQLQSPSDTPGAKSTLNRPSRRALVSMSTQMTRHNMPVSYLLGSMPFGNLPQELTVRPPILLPRPETEHWASEVVAAILAHVEQNPSREIRVADLCTGSGCIALLIAHALRDKLGDGGKWKVVACDKSPLAVELAKENAVKLGFKDANLTIVQADIFSDADMDRLAQLAGGPFDLVVSNPPYIPRREWEKLRAEVRAHEDPAALIGERGVLSAPSTTPASEKTDDRQTTYDRSGLAFHQRLAELLYRQSFITPFPQPGLPRLVGEFGKGQQKAVKRIHTITKSPADRFPRIIRIPNHMLTIVGVGNALTHPLTRHSIGQVVLDPLLQGLADVDRETRGKLLEAREKLETQRIEAIESGSIDPKVRPDWATQVPHLIPILNPADEPHFDPSSNPHIPGRLTEVTKWKGGGWAAHFSLLLPSPRHENHIFSIQIALFKPSIAMNLSGSAVRRFLSSHHPLHSGKGTHGSFPQDLLILQDELDLPFGEVKRRDKGSARGHNGVKDILKKLDIASEQGGPKLSRVQVGIGRPEGSKPIDKWVLSKLEREEMESCVEGEVQEKVSQEVKKWLGERCMQLFEQQKGEGEGEGGEEEGVRMGTDQFGMQRTVWVY